MVCSNCGQELNENVLFCTKCGTKCRGELKKSPWQYCLDVLNKYAVFQGRARRAEYWWFSLFVSIFSIITFVLDTIFTLRILGQGVLSSLLSLGIFLPGLSAGVRRMHDCDKSGWFILVPIYNLILCCTKGISGSNRYGADPKYIE